MEETYEIKNKYICPNKLLNKLDQFIRNIAKNNGFVKYDIEKKTVCTNGANYLGLLYEVDITGHTKDGEKELHLFVKSILPGESDLQILSIHNIYNAEIFAYKIISKIFDELQEEANVPVKERYKMVKMYEESDAEVIIMENVAKRGFSIGHRMDVVSIEFAEMAIEELAKFHSLSFVMEAKRVDFFEEQIKTRKSPYHSGEKWQSVAQNITKLLMDNIDEGIKKRIEKFCENIENRFTSCYENKLGRQSLCHGDYKPNNIMAKIVDGEVSELIPVDYQLMFYGCPILDFLYFTICFTDKTFRKKYLSHLKNVYHEAMARFLKYFDLDVDNFYSREEFEKDYANRLDDGLVMSFIFLPFIYAAKDNLPDFTKGDPNQHMSFNVDERYKSRMQEIIDDYIEWGVI